MQPLAVRLGGEEMLMLLPPCIDMSDMAETIRADIAAIDCREDGIRIPVSASIGAARLDDAGSLSHALKAADMAMYEAKAAGRNQVKLAA